MGRKIHPIGFRLKVNRDFDARWYAEGERYVELLEEDRMIRSYIKKETGHAGVSRIEIERYPNQVVVHIHTARPGIVIGRKGESVKELRKYLENKTKKKVKIEVAEISSPDTDAVLVAENIADQLVRRVGHSRAMKRAEQTTMAMGADGIRIQCSGRLGGADIARTEQQRQGRVPLQTLRAKIDYGFTEATTVYGIIGVKCWICHPDEEEV